MGNWRPASTPFLPKKGKAIHGIYFSRYEVELRALFIHTIAEKGNCNMTDLFMASRKYSHMGLLSNPNAIGRALWKTIAVEALKGDKKFVYFYHPTEGNPNALEIRFTIRNRRELKQSIKNLE